MRVLRMCTWVLVQRNRVHNNESIENLYLVQRKRLHNNESTENLYLVQGKRLHNNECTESVQPMFQQEDRLVRQEIVAGTQLILNM